MAGRKKLDRTSLHARVDKRTPERLKDIAYKLGYMYHGEGSTGHLLDAIASGYIILICRDTSQKNPKKLANNC